MSLLKKKATVKRLTTYLERHGWSHYREVDEADEEEGLILTGWQSGPSGSAYTLVVDPVIEKNVVAFTVRGVLKAPPDSTPAARLNGLLLAMAALNYRMLFGSWAFDPSDGEVVLKLAIPIASGDMPFEDFEHCLKMLVVTAEQQAPLLKAIMAGESSGIEALA